MSRRAEKSHDRLQQLADEWQRPSGGSKADWADMDAEIMRDAVAAITSVGDAILFGYTEDLGACTIVVFSGGKSKKFYERDMEIVAQLLNRLGRWSEKP